MGKRAKPSASLGASGQGEQTSGQTDSQALLAELAEQLRTQGEKQQENIDLLFDCIPAGNKDMIEQIKKMLEDVTAKVEQNREQIEKTTKIAESLSRNLKRLFEFLSEE